MINRDAIVWIGHQPLTAGQITEIHQFVENQEPFPYLEDIGPFMEDIQFINTHGDSEHPLYVYLDLSVTYSYLAPNIPTLMRTLHALKYMSGSVSENSKLMEELELAIACDIVSNGSVYFEQVKMILDLIIALNNYLGMNRLAIDSITFPDAVETNEIPEEYQPEHHESLIMASLFQIQVKEIA